MAEYIEREALVDAVESTDWYHVSMQGNLVHGAISDGNALYKADDIFKLLVDAPAADVVPVVHGRWDRGQCTNCKAINPAYRKDWNGDYIFKETPFCPNCGAKMDRRDTDG